MWAILIVQVCGTYPRIIAIPKSISDSVVRHAARFRSRGRLPILSYLHGDGAALLRSSQALVGIPKNRSIQDEHLIAAVISCSPRRELLIVDARPSKSAMANALSGAGFMPLEHYENCRRVYLGIENIHSVRDAYLRVFEGLLEEEMPLRKAKSEAGWIKFYEAIMEGVGIIVEHLKLGMAVLVHCSDGWDRTAQLVSLAQICLDPQVRTIEGFIALIQREWISAGHQFESRLARSLPINSLRPSSRPTLSRVLNNLTRTNTDDHINKPQDEYCPVFPQFLDCLLQFLRVYPTAFEFNQKLIWLIWRESYAMETDTFKGDCEKDRIDMERPICLWSLLRERRDEYQSQKYSMQGELEVTKDVLFYM